MLVNTIEERIKQVESMANKYGWNYVCTLAEILIATESIPPDTPVYCTATNAKTVLQVNDRQFYKLVRQNEIKKIKKGLYDARSILECMKTRKKKRTNKSSSKGENIGDALRSLFKIKTGV